MSSLFFVTSQALQTVAQSNPRTFEHQGADTDVISSPPENPPPSCNPQAVSQLTALGVVITLAEALVDCLLDGERRCDAALLHQDAAGWPYGLASTVHEMNF